MGRGRVRSAMSAVVRSEKGSMVGIGRYGNLEDHRE